MTLNVNGLNAPIKRHRVAKQIKETHTHTHIAYERLTIYKNTHRWKVRGW